MVADAAQNLDHRLDKANVEHGLGELNVAKVAGAVLGACAVSGALGTAVEHAQTGVGWTTQLWPSLVIADGLVDVGDGIAALCCDALRVGCCSHERGHVR